MIEHLRHMAVFARVVDEGSFRAAARALNLSPSRISETVSDLEAFLGITLLYRSTRKIALTNEGRIFHARVVEMVRSAEAGMNAVNALSEAPMGALRVSLPAFMSASRLARAMGTFLQEHRSVSLTLDFTDRQTGLIEAGYDLNIRVGWLDDSAMMSRKLGEEGRMLVAGQDYVAQRGLPTHPKDLELWDWVRYAQRSDVTELTAASGEVAKVTGRSQIKVDTIDALYRYTVQNLGATVLPRHLALRGIEEGDLVELLPAWNLRPLGFYAVWPDKSRRESLTLSLVRYLADRMAAQDSPS